VGHTKVKRPDKINQAPSVPIMCWRLGFHEFWASLFWYGAWL